MAKGTTDNVYICLISQQKRSRSAKKLRIKTAYTIGTTPISVFFFLSSILIYKNILV